jgi:hypothetical protein
MRCPSKDQLLKWVADCWLEIPTDIVVRSFKEAGVSQLQDGSEDHLIWNRGDEASAQDASDEEDGADEEPMTLARTDLTLHTF